MNRITNGPKAQVAPVNTKSSYGTRDVHKAMVKVTKDIECEFDCAEPGSCMARFAVKCEDCGEELENAIDFGMDLASLIANQSAMQCANYVLLSQISALASWANQTNKMLHASSLADHVPFITTENDLVFRASPYPAVNFPTGALSGAATTVVTSTTVGLPSMLPTAYPPVMSGFEHQCLTQPVTALSGFQLPSMQGLTFAPIDELQTIN